MILTPIVVAAVAALSPAQPEKPQPEKMLVAYPHPLITEVLYAVPTQNGDANKDGAREANGDEFIELINPHDKPIQLRGYVLSGKGPRGAGGGGGGEQSDGSLRKQDKKFTTLRFTFPTLELRPGEVVVVFNGHGQSWSGSVGDSDKAPEGPNEHFDNARVLSMKVESSRLGLVNGADFVLLTAPSGERVHCISWGDIKTPEGVTLSEAAPSTQGSITRLTPTGELIAHPSLDGQRFSPGRFPMISDGKPASPAATVPGDPK